MKTGFPFLALILLLACLPARSAAAAETGRERDFNGAWKFFRGDAPGAEQEAFDDRAWRVLDLPHDWSIEDLAPGGSSEPEATIGPFSRRSPGGASTGHVLGGVGWYRKRFALEEGDRGKRISVLFDGIYMEADVWVNGRHVGSHVHGYTPFAFDLSAALNPAGESNLLAVRVRNEGENSRWYSGSGIYRNVRLLVTDPVHVDLWGVTITTPRVSEASATVVLRTAIVNAGASEVRILLRTRCIGPQGAAAGSLETPGRVAAGGRVELSQTIEVAAPRLWSVETPHLYRAAVEVVSGDRTVDRVETPFGIRSLQFDAEHGFRLNGNPVLLRGGCMHHDNGPLGAAAIDRAEERRVELFKRNGFNAVRSSHNPPSSAFLDACDRQGLLVIDEAFDMWELSKKPNDYHRFFKLWWERDLIAMVMRDRNHPCVILWSIGNEIKERADPAGLAITRRLADTVRRLDPTRPVTEAVCHFWEFRGRPWSDTVPLFALLDVCGYNYQWREYASDHASHPERIIAGTESFPMEAFENWEQVERHPWIIGDFVWTGMDYLGESGIGHAVLTGEPSPSLMPWPWHNAYCGDLDLCGFKKPQSYYRDVVWRRSRIEMAVHVPLPEGKREVISKWGWPDTRRSWTWPGEEGKPMQVAVYSRCPEVRLDLNGKTIGVQPTSAETKLTASFSVAYAPGTLRAVGLQDGNDVASIAFQTHGEPRAVRLTPDRSRIRADRGDLCYVTAEIVDEAGRRVEHAATPVRFQVEGAGSLAAVGSGHPSDMASFQAPVRAAFRGRCLAILRPTGRTGTITLTATAEGLTPAAISVEAGP